MLTEKQKQQFETLGFLLLKDFIPQDEMKVYIGAFDETMLKANGGEPWTRAPKRQQVIPFYRHNTEVYHHLLDHEKVNGMLEELIGPEFVFAVAEGIHAYGGTYWHHDDVPPENHTHLKVVFFLDPVRADTGCLSVLPGSHFAPYRERMEKHGKGILSSGKDVPGTYPIEADPGDAVIFNVKLYHAAFGDGVERRGIYINYYGKPKTPEEEDHLVNIYQRDGASGYEYYTPELFEDASPERMQMLKFLKERCYDPSQAT